MCESSEGGFLPQAKVLRVLKLILKLYHGHYNVHQIADLLDCSPRTAYRYIRLIDEVGITVESDFSNKFFVAQDECPFCHGAIKEAIGNFAIPDTSIPEYGEEDLRLTDALTSSISIVSVKSNALVLTLAQAQHISSIPNLARRIRKDLDQALLMADHHMTGDWGPYTTKEMVPEERISILLYNDPERIESGKAVVECLVNGFLQG